MGVRITDSVTWVGKIDWELQKFHGEEYSTFKGSSYNSYLVRDEKTVLIDTVYRPYAKEFVAQLEHEIDLDSIDYIIANHAEVDHSGAMPELMERIPNVPIYCSPQAVKSLKGHYHKDWDFRPVKTGDTLALGAKTITFVNAAMLHWPDSMFSYLDKENILFSNDAFGHHLASARMFNDLVDEGELMHECMKYYANILTPFNKLVVKKIHEVVGFGLPVDYIMPSHGIIWRDNPLQIVHKYLEWAEDYQEKQVVVLYDTMWNSTRDMAECIAEGIRKASPELEVKLFNVGQRDKNEVILEVFKSRLVVAGSSTINKGILSGMAGLLEMIKGLGFKNKFGAAFGSYGWSGEGAGIVSEWLEKSGFEMLAEPLKVLWKPDEEARAQCEAYGAQLAERL
ncbi:anaerobic nitric oxide reductase flavorubredoxin [Desulfovibrio mangrovi]|uniref:anaerobic nitric oxide reductase flavorubredoxin n=1 Tax=Desulfovibrio mangrovi TaxID=2976983 RepID=UPI002247AB77|nr:anaerobic nitric oxide reductase flavorubredoxin [Desulfovibrio mangrovi]UZP67061.1 anaerobic nitric oxide reductase flavorubredoxin [Desulfovibrio mangrovi]